MSNIKADFKMNPYIGAYAKKKKSYKKSNSNKTNDNNSGDNHFDNDSLDNKLFVDGKKKRSRGSNYYVIPKDDRRFVDEYY